MDALTRRAFLEILSAAGVTAIVGPRGEIEEWPFDDVLVRPGRWYVHVHSQLTITTSTTADRPNQVLLGYIEVGDGPFEPLPESRFPVFKIVPDKSTDLTLSPKE